MDHTSTVDDASALAETVRGMAGSTAVVRACAELLTRSRLDNAEVATLSATISARATTLEASLQRLLAQLDQ